MLCPLQSLQQRTLLADSACIFKGISFLSVCQARLLPCSDAREKALGALLLTPPGVYKDPCHGQEV